MVRKAAIDIGTNTTRLLIADLYPNGTFEEVFSSRITTRLGEGLSKCSLLDKTAVYRTINALTIYSENIKKYDCSKVRAVATSAVREAKNRDIFVERVKNKTGLHIEIINQKEEARLATKGVLKGLKEIPGKALIFDIGGGSTEYILSDKNDHPIKIAGLLMGTVHLTENHLKSDPINMIELQSLRNEVKKKLRHVEQELGNVQDFMLIGTAGTHTQFAALDLDLFPYDPVAINGHKMTFPIIEKIFNELKSKTVEERKAISAMEQGREDLIIAGGIVLMESMKILKKDEITISDFGLREGLLFD